MTEIAKVRTCSSKSPEAIRAPSGDHESRVRICLGEKLAPLLAKLDRSARDALVAQATATLLQVVEDAAYRMQVWVSGLNSENALVGKIYNGGDEAIDRVRKYEIASRMSSIMSREEIITLLIAQRDSEVPGECVSFQAAQSPIDRAAVTCIAVNITCGFLEHEVGSCPSTWWKIGCS